MYNSVSIANFFIDKSFYEGVEITPMKVLKLVYIAHGWHLGITQKPLINEQTEAWKYGPVVPSVYGTFKIFGKSDINKVIMSSLEVKQDFKEIQQNEEISAFLDKIWEVYKDYTGGDLSNLTHQSNTPWDVTWNKNNGSLKQGAIIPNKVIQEYYENKAKEIL